MVTLTVLITGANRGVGLEFARQYAAEGWRVHACCRHPEEASELTAALAGHNGVIHRLDVTHEHSIHTLVEALEDEALDVLINNAGVIGGEHQDFGDIDYAMWRTTIRTNVLAPYRVAEALLDRLDAGGQRVIANVSSLMGSITDNSSGGDHIYRTSKTALNMVTDCLAMDLRSRGLHVVSFHPGWVRTDMGGAGAPVTPEQSAAGMRRQIAEVGAEQSGRFYNFDGPELAW